MKPLNGYWKFIALTGVLTGALTGVSHAGTIDSPMSINVRNAPIKEVLESIASKAGLRLELDQDLALNVTLAKSDMSARALLDKLSRDNPIEYSISGNQLFVQKSRSSTVSTISSESNEIILHYALASELVTKVSPVIGSEGKVIADEHSNKLIILGPRKVYEKIKSIVNYFDSPQKQIMIEAIIVETSHKFLQNLGVSLNGVNNGGNLAANTATAGPSSPNGTFNVILGQVSSAALNVQLNTAEQKGDAKVVSRPKVVTLNNRAAKVESGVTFNVKTLSNVSAGTATSTTTASSQGVVTGSVTSIDALLSLSIVPLLIGEDEIKLSVDINDSSPDLSQAVDGIPGIVKNTASTAVIIKNKQTAVIAGLVKQSKSKTKTGVPFLSDIPILGWLFQSNSVNDSNNELVIFLTPTIDESGSFSIRASVDPALLLKSPLDEAPKPTAQ